MTITTEQPGQQTPAVSGAAAPGPRLGRLVRSELIKVRTTNLWWILAICAVVATALALGVNSLIAHSEISNAMNPPNFSEGYPPGMEPSPAEVADMEANWRAQNDLGEILIRNAANLFTSGQFFGLLIALLFGALLVTSEYYHQTATTTFLTAPHRSRVILSKVATAIIGAGVLWFATTALDLGVGTLFFSAEGQPTSLDVWSVQRAIVMNLPAYALWALLGMGLGALIRNQIAATLVGAGLYLIGGQIAQLVFIAVYSFWIEQAWVLQSMVALPAVASSIMISPERVQIWNTDAGDPIYAPHWWVGALILIGYGVIATWIGTLLIRKRDIS